MSGEVLTELSSDTVIDWIELRNHGEDRETQNVAASLPHVFIRGACLVSPLAHYFRMSAKEVTGEFNHIRQAVSIRIGIRANDCADYVCRLRVRSHFR